mgnify:CR=1 FL=1
MTTEEKKNITCGFLYAVLWKYSHSLANEHPKSRKFEECLKELGKGNLYSFIEETSSVDDAYDIIMSCRDYIKNVDENSARALKWFCSVYPSVYKSHNKTKFKSSDFYIN